METSENSKEQGVSIIEMSYSKVESPHTENVRFFFPLEYVPKADHLNRII